MRRAHFFATIAAGAVAIGGVALLASTPQDAAAQAPGVSATQAPGASATPSASPVSSALAPIPGSVVSPSLASRTIPTDKSDVPPNDAWAKADALVPTRRSRRARACTLQVIREYARIACPQLVAALRQYAGPSEDVRLFAQPKSNAPGAPSLWDPPNGGHITVPLRRGTAYLFQFHEIDPGYDGFGVAGGVVVDVTWPESQPGPSVVLR